MGPNQANAARLRLAFMGTPDFALPALAALADHHAVCAVYCQPPRPAGRGQKETASPVEQAARARGIEVRHPVDLKAPASLAEFRALDLDLAVVVAYGLLLPQDFLDAPKYGCLNIHASLLPRWRGAAPIQRAIEAGDLESGITIMEMEAGLDSGPILLQKRLALAAEETGQSLHDKLAALGAAAILEAIDGLLAGRIRGIAQPAEGVTYARKLDRAEARIDWREPADLLARRLRAFTPWPGLWFDYGSERLRLLAARALTEKSDQPPGTILRDRLRVVCGGGSVLRLDRLQRAGRQPLEADAFLRGLDLPAGRRLP